MFGCGLGWEVFFGGKFGLEVLLSSNEPRYNCQEVLEQESLVVYSYGHYWRLIGGRIDLDIGTAFGCGSGIFRSLDDL